MGCLDVWAPQEMPACPSLVPVAPLVSRAPEVFQDFRVPLGSTANRAGQDQRGRWDLKDKREKRVSVASTHTGVNRARLASKAHQGHQALPDQVDLWGTQDCQGPWGHRAYLGLLDRRETQASRATTAGRENGACQGCQANTEQRVNLGSQEPRVKRGLRGPQGHSASWGRRGKKAMLETPLEEAEGSPVPQGFLDPQGQRGKLEQMARQAPQDGKETRAPRAKLGKERWWTTMATSTRLSRRSGHWP